jgi:hypothetical protein
MSHPVVILVGATAAGIGFFLGLWLAPLLRPSNDPAVTPPVMSRRVVQELRETVIAMEAQIEKLERQVKGQSSRRNP